MKNNYSDIHSHTYHNKDELNGSTMCGCICCERVFKVDEIERWIDNGDTALCPYCGTDSLIADAYGVELSKPLLNTLNKKYF